MQRDWWLDATIIYGSFLRLWRHMRPTGILR